MSALHLKLKRWNERLFIAENHMACDDISQTKLSYKFVSRRLVGVGVLALAKLSLGRYRTCWGGRTQREGRAMLTRTCDKEIMPAVRLAAEEKRPIASRPFPIWLIAVICPSASVRPSVRSTFSFQILISLSFCSLSYYRTPKLPRLPILSS